MASYLHFKMYMRNHPTTSYKYNIYRTEILNNGNDRIIAAKMNEISLHLYNK